MGVYCGRAPRLRNHTLTDSSAGTYRAVEKRNLREQLCWPGLTRSQGRQAWGIKGLLQVLTQLIFSDLEAS